MGDEHYLGTRLVQGRINKLGWLTLNSNICSTDNMLLPSYASWRHGKRDDAAIRSYHGKGLNFDSPISSLASLLCNRFPAIPRRSCPFSSPPFPLSSLSSDAWHLTWLFSIPDPFDFIASWREEDEEKNDQNKHALLDLPSLLTVARTKSLND